MRLLLVAALLAVARTASAQCNGVICEQSGTSCVYCPYQTQCIANDRCTNNYCCCSGNQQLCDLPDKHPYCVASPDDCYECDNGGVDCGMKKCCPAGATCTSTGCCPANAPNDCKDGTCCGSDEVCVSGGCCPKAQPFPCGSNTCSADPSCAPSCPQGYQNCGNNWCCPGGTQCGQGTCTGFSNGTQSGTTCPNGFVKCGTSHCAPTGTTCCAGVGREDLYCQSGTCVNNGGGVTCNAQGSAPINPPRQQGMAPTQFQAPTSGGGGGCSYNGKKTGMGPGCFGLSIAGGGSAPPTAILGALLVGLALLLRRRGRP